MLQNREMIEVTRGALTPLSERVETQTGAKLSEFALGKLTNVAVGIRRGIGCSACTACALYLPKDITVCGWVAEGNRLDVAPPTQADLLRVDI